jgi:hypothetical protein
METEAPKMFAPKRRTGHSRSNFCRLVIWDTPSPRILVMYVHRVRGGIREAVVASGVGEGGDDIGSVHRGVDVVMLFVVEGSRVIFGVDAADQTSIAGGARLAQLAAEGASARLGVAERLAFGIDIGWVSGGHQMGSLDLRKQEM